VSDVRQCINYRLIDMLYQFTGQGSAVRTGKQGVSGHVIFLFQQVKDKVRLTRVECSEL